MRTRVGFARHGRRHGAGDDDADGYPTQRGATALGHGKLFAFDFVKKALTVVEQIGASGV